MTTRFLAAAVLALVLTACDSSSPDDEPTPNLTGRWTATTAFNHDSLWVLPNWASLDSIRYAYTGSQIITLVLNDQAGAVTGTIDWDEAGTLTVTTYRDGTISNQTPGPISQDETDAIRATFAAPTLTFDRFNNALISTQLEAIGDGGIVRNFTLDVDGDVARSSYNYRLIETELTGPNGETVTIGAIGPTPLVFQRIRTTTG